MASNREVEHNNSRCQRSHFPGERSLQHFFKIILPSTLENKKLRIPDEFVRKFGDELSDAACIVVPNGHAWQVGLTKDQKNIWFEDGWHEFVEHNSICDGYSLVFRYRGFSNFSVLIFDLTSCEIQYPCNGLKSGKGPNCDEKWPIHHENDVEHYVATKILGSAIPPPFCCSLQGRAFVESARKGESSKRHTPSEQDLGMNKHPRNVSSLKRSKKHVMEEQVETTDCDAGVSRKGKSDKHGMSSAHGPLVNEKDSSTCKTKIGEEELLPKCEEDVETLASEMFTSGLKGEYSQESERAIHAARMFKTKNPSFMVMLRPYNADITFLNVPGGFSTKFLSEVPECIKLRVSDGREWSVKVIRSKRAGLTLGRGWHDFCRENNLEGGDVCVFELIKSKVVFEVSIFHAVQGVGPELKADIHL